MRKAATATQEAQEVLALVEQQRQEQLECSTNKVKRIRAVSRAGPYERA